MPLSLGLRMGLSAGSSLFGWVPAVEGSSAAVAFNGTQFALPAYGPELVTNGGFDTDTTGWTAETCTLTVSGGALRATSTTNGSAAWVARQDVTTVPGKLYEFKATFIGSGGPNVTAGRIEVRRTDGVAITQTAASLPSNGSILTLHFTATDTTTRFRVRGDTGAGGVSGSSYVDFDNVSVREVMLGEMGTNLGASGYTMSVNGGSGTATESPTGTLNLTGDGTNPATADKAISGLTVGRHYRCVFLVATNTPQFRVGTTSGGAETVPNTTVATGVASFEFTATATTHHIRFTRSPASIATVSSITIAEWTPRPTLRSVPLNTTYGPELVTNGTFNADLTGWTDQSSAPCTAAWSSGAALLTSGASVPGLRGSIRQTLTFTPGRLYELRISTGNGTSSGVYQIYTRISGSTFALAAQTISTNLSATHYFTPTISSAEIELFSPTGLTTTAIFDNVSVREVTSPGAFGNGSSLTGEVFAFTASSTTARTYVGSDGLTKNDLAADAPRVDYSNGKARYLFENQSTNLFQRSEEFDNAYWSKGNATVTSGVGAAPTGATTADSVVPNTVSATHAVFRNETVTSGIPYTVSVYVKASGYNFVALGIHNGATSAGNEVIRVFDLSNGVTASSYNTAPTTSTIQSVGNGWYRIAITWTLTTTSLNMSLFPLPTDQNPRTVWVGDNASGCLAWGAQLEAQSFASSYIPTTSATVTRLIETARFSPLVEAIFQLPGATARVQGATPGDQFGRILGLGTGLADYIISRNGASQAFAFDAGGTAVVNNLGSGAFSTGYGVAAAYNSGGRGLSGNGASTSTNSTSISSSRATVYLARAGTVSAANPYADGYYSSFALWPFRATNANVSAIAVAPT
jgi:hypothetical protein